MVTKGKRTNPNTSITKKPFYVHLSNKYASLPAFAVDPPNNSTNNNPMTGTTPPATTKTNKPSKFKLRNQRRALARKLRRDKSNNENALIDEHITWAEDERTVLAKADTSNKQRRSIDTAHATPSSKPISILQRGRNLGYAMSTTARDMVRTFIKESPHVRFASHNQVYRYQSEGDQSDHEGSSTFPAVKFLDSIKQIMAGIYNPKNSQGDGMLALSDKGSAISQVKSNSIATLATVLKMYKDKAAAESDADTVVVPLVTEHGQAQEEADRDNAFYQSVLGTKEGIAKGVAAQVGAHITNPILRKAASTDTKMVDEYQIEDLFDAVKAGAQRPAATDILTQLTAIVSFCFDFQHKASTNMEILRDSIARLASFGVTVDATQIAIVILANVEYAAKHPWGNEYKHARDTIGRKYQYNHTHDDASIKDILSILEDADKARTMGRQPLKI